MTIERKPVAFGDLRGWIARSRRTASCTRSTPRSTGTSSSAPSCGSRRGPGTGKAILFNNIKDYNKPDEPLPPHLRLGAQQQPPHRHDARPAAGDARARTGQARPHHPAGTHPAAHRQRRPVQGERHRREGHRSRRISGAAVEPARRRPLSHHLRGRRHQGPRHRRDERRHLSRHDRQQEPHPDPDVARAAYRPPRHRLAGARPEGNADRGRDRLGAVARLLRRLAGAQGHLRIRRDGRTSAASRSISSNARRATSTCRPPPRS